MSAIFIMIGASLLLAIGFLIAFIWSVKSNQYEDDYTPSVRMLFDNTTIQENKQETNKTYNKYNNPNNLCLISFVIVIIKCKFIIFFLNF
jgi:cbb3-type cytochrome oxidase maturation protein